MSRADLIKQICSLALDTENYTKRQNQSATKLLEEVTRGRISEEDELSPPLRQVLWRTYQIGSCRKSVIKPRQHQRSQITLQVKRGENIP